MTREELLKQIEIIMGERDEDGMDEFGYIDSFTYNLLLGVLNVAAAGGICIFLFFYAIWMVEVMLLI